MAFDRGEVASAPADLSPIIDYCERMARLYRENLEIAAEADLGERPLLSGYCTVTQTKTLFVARGTLEQHRAKWLELAHAHERAAMMLRQGE